MGYLKTIDDIASLREGHPSWGAINSEYVARMRLQNRFRTGLDIARYTAD
jgi:isocitrate lyase